MSCVAGTHPDFLTLSRVVQKEGIGPLVTARISVVTIDSTFHLLEKYADGETSLRHTNLIGQSQASDCEEVGYF